jgi:TolA-binding protein
MNLFKQAPTDKPEAKEQEAGLVEWFLIDFWPRFGKQTLYVLGGIAIIVSASVWYNNDHIASQARENKELGPAYIYYSEDKLDSAEAFLNAFIKTGHSSLVQDKANLMLGQILYAKGRYDDAIAAYGRVDLSGSAHGLISSGALHGLGASYIQKKDYAKAAENLEKFVSKFQRRTGAPTEKVEGKEVADLSPAVPNALWKLTLCYRELKDSAKEKAIAEKLVKVYPESKEAFDATRLLAQIP